MSKKQQTKKNKPLYTDYLYGSHSVLECLLAKRRKIGKVYTTKKPIKSWHRISELIPSHVEVSFVSRQVLDDMTNGAEHQGIVMYASPFQYQKQIFSPKKEQFVMVLDGVQDVRNYGAILRSAYCAGVDGVIVCSRNSAPLNAAAIKSSAGLAEHVRVYIASSVNFALAQLKKDGYNIYLATLGKGENAAAVAYESPSVIVIGSEEKGISKEVMKHGTRVLLPQRRSDISYNASVAAGILMVLIGVQIKKI